MAYVGPEPKERKHGRTPTADWTDVVDVPFDGSERLDLPKRRGLKWSPEVVRWWDVVSRMPHCVLWAPSDWMFALETAFMKQDWWTDFAAGEVITSKSTEIRRREGELGTTAEARRKLRVRYVDADGSVAQRSEPGAVASLAERRRRLTSAS